MSKVLASEVIYPAQSLMTLISRAWNLLRVNFKSSLLIMLGPILLLSVMNLLTGILSGGTFLTSASPVSLGLQGLVALLFLVLIIPCFFLWVFSSCALSRLYFSAIVSSQPLSVRSCWRYVAKHWRAFSAFSIVLGLILVILTVVNLIILYLGILLSVFLISGLTASAVHFSQNPLAGVILILFLLVWGFVVLMAVISLVTFQSFCFAFPLLALSTAPQDGDSWLRLIGRCYRLLFQHSPRLILFSLALFCFSFVMMSVLMVPVWTWAIMEFTRLGISHQHHLPMYIQAVLNVWGSLVNLILFPFHISAVTFIWYDCQVRSEGLDLRLWLSHILRRRGRQPEELGILVEPQAV